MGMVYLNHIHSFFLWNLSSTIFIIKAQKIFENQSLLREVLQLNTTAARDQSMLTGKSRKQRPGSSGRAKRLSVKSHHRKRAMILYGIMLPALVILLVYKYIPMVSGILISFKDFRIARGILASEWVGFENFEKMFASPFFPMILKNTIFISLKKLLFGFPAPIILALMINEVRQNQVKRLFQTAYYLPHFISWIVIGNMLFAFFAPESGALSPVFNALGIPFNPLMNTGIFQEFLVATEIWKEIGWGCIIYLAAITAIDPSMYEAAIIDGANKRHQLLYVTLPTLLPTIMTMLLMRVGQILDAGFDQIFILQNDIVYRVSEILDTYVYKLGFEQGDYAMGTVAGLFKSVIGLVMVVTVNKIAARFDSEVV